MLLMNLLWIWVVLLASLGWSASEVGVRTVEKPSLTVEGSNKLDARERFGELERQLADKDAAQRRRAVRDLAQLGGRDAWELVIGALADEKGEVADEAQFWLPGIDDDRLLAGLMGRAGLTSKNELVKLRVAEALGRFHRELDGEDLLGKVNRLDALAGEMVLWSVERLARADRLGGKLERCGSRLEKLVKAKGPGALRAQAACTLSAISPERARELLPKWLGDKAPELRRGALLCAIDMGLDEAQAMGSRLRGDAVPAVRLAALDAIASGENKRALESLIARMVDEPRYRLKIACLEHLQALTGRKTKLNARAWSGWVASQPEDWTPSARSRGPV
ncbi:MAG: hypothetical protein P8N31_12330 [Planctomycetota bacterium]|nr:hypothetical protein [Planctomycetota bacterium]